MPRYRYPSGFDYESPWSDFMNNFLPQYTRMLMQKKEAEEERKLRMQEAREERDFRSQEAERNRAFSEQQASLQRGDTLRQEALATARYEEGIEREDKQRIADNIEEMIFKGFHRGAQVATEKADLSEADKTRLSSMADRGVELQELTDAAKARFASGDFEGALQDPHLPSEFVTRISGIVDKRGTLTDQQKLQFETAEFMYKQATETYNNATLLEGQEAVASQALQVKQEALNAMRRLAYPNKPPVTGGIEADAKSFLQSKGFLGTAEQTKVLLDTHSPTKDETGKITGWEEKTEKEKKEKQLSFGSISREKGGMGTTAFDEFAINVGGESYTLPAGLAKKAAQNRPNVRAGVRKMLESKGLSLKDEQWDELFNFFPF